MHRSQQRSVALVRATLLVVGMTAAAAMLASPAGGKAYPYRLIDSGALGAPRHLVPHAQSIGSLGGTVTLSTWNLGTLGGDNGSAHDINDGGHVTGSADLANGTHHAFFWGSGAMRDLAPPPIPGALCSNGESINNKDDVVGNATDCHGNELAAVLWKQGIPYDLNRLIAPTGMRLDTADYIDNAGEIFGAGAGPNGARRAFLLVPTSGRLTR